MGFEIKEYKSGKKQLENSKINKNIISIRPTKILRIFKKNKDKKVIRNIFPLKIDPKKYLKS